MTSEENNTEFNEDDEVSRPPGSDMSAPQPTGEPDEPTGEDPAGQLRLVGQDENGVGITAERIVEAILFSCDSPLSSGKIASVVGAITGQQVRKIVEQLNSGYDESNRAFRIEQLGGGFQMMTRPEFVGHLQRLHNVRSESRLSTAALETLAVVAYKQPVLRAETEAIRGVACGEMLRSLMEKGLVKIVGRSEELGRPMLYGTTKRFLEVFGLASLTDLPKVPELRLPGGSEPSKPVEDDPNAEPSVEETVPDDQTDSSESEPT